MASKRKYDLAVKNGTYQVQGEQKNRYVTVGSVLERDDGGMFILLERWFNPAGIPDDGKGSVLLSCFEPRDPKGKSKPQEVDDAIPF